MMMVVEVVEWVDIDFDVLGLIRLAKKDNIPRKSVAQIEPVANGK
jgi:hypothetical protein